MFSTEISEATEKIFILVNQKKKSKKIKKQKKEKQKNTEIKTKNLLPNYFLDNV